MTAYMVTIEVYHGATGSWREQITKVHGWHGVLSDIRRLRQIPHVRVVSANAA